jgi:hypothetical protein
MKTIARTIAVAGLGVCAALPPLPGAAQTAPPPTAAPEQKPGETAERVRVEGFRSAHWGMTEAQVKAAIQKDFNIAGDKVRVEENPSERTTVLAVSVNDLLEGAGVARISYILGYASKKLIQVNIVWGTTVDPQAKPERIVAAANQLRALFLSSGYEPETIAGNLATADGTIVVFQGEDAAKHLTLLRLVSTPAPPPAKQRGRADRPGPTVVLLLSYVQDARNPDVFRLKKGQF